MEHLKTAILLAGGAAALAAKVQVSQSTPHMWLRRGSVPAEHCAAIERATKGKVMRWDLCPTDWHRIWPELMRKKGAPAIEVKAAA